MRLQGGAGTKRIGQPADFVTAAVNRIERARVEKLIKDKLRQGQSAEEIQRSLGGAARGVSAADVQAGLLDERAAALGIETNVQGIKDISTMQAEQAAKDRAYSETPLGTLRDEIAIGFKIFDSLRKFISGNEALDKKKAKESLNILEIDIKNDIEDVRAGIKDAPEVNDKFFYAVAALNKLYESGQGLSKGNADYWADEGLSDDVEYTLRKNRLIELQKELIRAAEEGRLSKANNVQI